jgi:hypothetical protein
LALRPTPFCSRGPPLTFAHQTQANECGSAALTAEGYALDRCRGKPLVSVGCIRIVVRPEAKPRRRSGQGRSPDFGAPSARSVSAGAGVAARRLKGSRRARGIPRCIDPARGRSADRPQRSCPSLQVPSSHFRIWKLLHRLRSRKAALPKPDNECGSAALTAEGYALDGCRGKPLVSVGCIRIVVRPEAKPRRRSGQGRSPDFGAPSARSVSAGAGVAARRLKGSRRARGIPRCIDPARGRSADRPQRSCPSLQVPGSHFRIWKHPHRLKEPQGRTAQAGQRSASAAARSAVRCMLLLCSLMVGLVRLRSCVAAAALPQLGSH